jgi:hypothetical protein
MSAQPRYIQCLSAPAFDGDISGWNTANVVDASSVFCQSVFWRHLNWDVSRVENMSHACFFEQPVLTAICRVGTSSVTDMTKMFQPAQIQ